jgi:hypothetical protein
LVHVNDHVACQTLCCMSNSLLHEISVNWKTGVTSWKIFCWIFWKMTKFREKCEISSKISKFRFREVLRISWANFAKSEMKISRNTKRKFREISPMKYLVTTLYRMCFYMNKDEGSEVNHCCQVFANFSATLTKLIRHIFCINFVIINFDTCKLCYV